MGEQKYCLSIATANTSGKQYLIEKQSIYTGLTPNALGLDFVLWSMW